MGKEQVTVVQLGPSDVLWTLLVLILPFLIYRTVSKRFRSTRKKRTLRSVAIVVLGDVGRSPRMMYHAQSFAAASFETYLIGYKGVSLPPSLLEAPRINTYYLAPVPPIPRKLFILLAPLKVLFQVVSILNALLFALPHPPEFIIVQNPPSIPTLALVQLAGRIVGSKIIIDWHNLGFSLLALKLGGNHLLVKIAKWFERTFGRSAYAHLFVTEAMKDYLTKEWNLVGKTVVLHDRPPSHFHAASPIETHELFLRLPPFSPPLGDFLPKCSPPHSTSRTQLQAPNPNSPGGFHPSTLVPCLRQDRPALVVSSTSWTADEDFSILIYAMRRYESKAKTANRNTGTPRMPKMLVIVTGKGPMRDSYMEQIRQLEEREKWEWVRCRSMWLEAGDYPSACATRAMNGIGSADLGVSLHTSSSALDLPMKVVDMFGCGLPVCALDFACLGELVKDGVNGRVFRDGEELAGLFEQLLASYPAAAELDRLQAPLKDRWMSWEENWNGRVRGLVVHG